MVADYCDGPFCGGLVTGVGKGAKSGKGESRDGGPGRGESGMRNNKIMLWPAYVKSGTDVNCSSRWDEEYQIYDLYWTPKSIHQWWESKSYDWVFIQELPWDKRREDFVWDAAIDVFMKELRKQRFIQKMQFFKKQRREQRAAEQW